MTQRLFDGDVFLQSFDAQVIALRPDGWVALDRTAFFPAGGGQPCDTGWFIRGKERGNVTDVQINGDVIWHQTELPLKAGDRVQGHIHWERRWDHMQQHAADHLLAGALWRQWGGVTLGLHLGKEDSSIDVRMPQGRTRLTDEEIDALETTVNHQVQRDETIRCWYPIPEELARLPLRKAPPQVQQVRVVQMGEEEVVACCGTHPRSTGQIGVIKILSTVPAKGIMRLRFVAGMRAVRWFQAAYRCAHRVASALSADVSGAAAALEKEKAAAAAAERDMEKRLTQAALEMIRQGKRESVYTAYVPFATPSILVRCAGELTRTPGTVALLSCPGKGGNALVFARGEGEEMDMVRLLQESGGRGGGKADLAQGNAPDDQALHRAEEACRK